jgi:thymidylate kinase
MSDTLPDTLPVEPGKRTARLYIIEGPDCAGKTTLCRKMTTDYATSGAVINPGMDTGAQWYFDAMDYSMEHGCVYRIMDRCWLSDAIYSKLKGKTPNITPDDFQRLNDRALELGVKFKMLLPRYGLLLKRYRGRGDDYITEEELRPLWREYNQYVEQPIFTWQPYARTSKRKS